MSDTHRLEDAIKRGELTDEEAYFILRFAGHMGYEKALKRFYSPFHNIRNWFVWFGGWEVPRLAQWDRNKPAWEFTSNYDGKRRLKGPWPLSFFGHRITFFGKWFQFKFGKGYVTASHSTCVHWPDKLYWSPDGTPHHKRARLLLGRRGCRNCDD